MDILVFYTREPVLEITTWTDEGPNKGNRYGLHRDRHPDHDWNELRNSLIDDRCVMTELTDELKIILLEDLAYTYGADSTKFSQKLKEFKLI